MGIDQIALQNSACPVGVIVWTAPKNFLTHAITSSARAS
jgi:hypothetical protein